MAFVVLITSAGQKPALRIFGSRMRARSYCETRIRNGADRIDIYELPDIDDERKAETAFRMGEGVWLEARSQYAPETQKAWAELAALF